MPKILRCELLKFIYGYGILIILTTILGTQMLYCVLRASAINTMITQTSFMIEFFTGFLLNPIIPILLIVFSAQTIADDYAMGTSKFLLISKLEKKDLLLGKLVFLVFITVVSLSLTFIVSYITSKLLLNGDLSFRTVIKYYLYSVPSLITICSFVTLVGLLVDNFQNTILLGIGTLFLMIILDNLYEKGRYFTFTYPISIGGNVSNYFQLLPTIIYFVLTVIISIIIMKRKDLTL